ncbi:antibiotic biosynthesis monooxygenase family protein [Eilatimonas milleporae]|uniref:Heme-degrading monooxygenase HmoA n=1 Tax=Eilatimonas milleporae TaxID=911205 RepID=A0A3M0CCV6_9PROT|nr:antibiotic biosynthesis monooxygenase [Eilatimonas milleporae]RMB04586.1 heme-degrading monooxygenase HmoA [Eilatimonas milleporae]
MYIAMNRFKIVPGSETAFEDVWARRDSHLHTVPGFQEFQLVRGPRHDDYTLYASHTVWDTEDAFLAWTKSDAFRQAHRDAGDNTGLYLGPPEFEGFTAVLNSRAE